MWIINDESKVYSSEEVRYMIEALPHKVFFISGPTKSGKTPLIKSLQVQDKLIISSETFVEVIIEMCQNKENTTIDGLMSAFDSYKLLCIEDSDINLGGRDVTQELISDFLKEYLEKGTAVFTGINLDKWLVTLIKLLDEDKRLIFKSVE